MACCVNNRHHCKDPGADPRERGHRTFCAYTCRQYAHSRRRQFSVLIIEPNLSYSFKLKPRSQNLRDLQIQNLSQGGGHDPEPSQTFPQPSRLWFLKSWIRPCRWSNGPITNQWINSEAQKRFLTTCTVDELVYSTGLLKTRVF